MPMSLTEKNMSVNFIHLALVVQRVDNIIRHIGCYSADKCIGWSTFYPLDSDLSTG